LVHSVLAFYEGVSLAGVDDLDLDGVGNAARPVYWL